jgi:hypothetical protein
MYMRIREITQLTEAVNLRPDPAHVRQLVMAQLPKYAKKSIPIAGWAFMLYDLYVRVVEEKDYKGAMMSLGVDSLAAVAAVFTGGMAGFAVQMVGISALLTRDLYGKIYCLDPKTRQPMLCTPGKEHNTALQLEDDKFPGYEQRREEFQALIKDILDDIANSILSVLPKDTAKISGAAGAANARNALRNSNTAGNPSPALHPERYPK